MSCIILLHLGDAQVTTVDILPRENRQTGISKKAFMTPDNDKDPAISAEPEFGEEYLQLLVDYAAGQLNEETVEAVRHKLDTDKNFAVFAARVLKRNQPNVYR